VSSFQKTPLGQAKMMAMIAQPNDSQVFAKNLYFEAIKSQDISGITGPHCTFLT